jgi:hydroxymethylglutaryl-CoA lyase
MAELIIHDVGPRDGLQIEKTTVPTGQKIAWIDALIASGVDIVQVGSFVHKEKVPQMADTDALFTHYAQPDRKPARTRLSGLVLNEKGMERAFACGVDYLCMGVSASDTHSRKNTGMSTAEAADRIMAMATSARPCRCRCNRRSGAASKEPCRRTACSVSCSGSWTKGC